MEIHRDMEINGEFCENVERHKKKASLLLHRCFMLTAAKHICIANTRMHSWLIDQEWRETI